MGHFGALIQGPPPVACACPQKQLVAEPQWTACRKASLSQLSGSTHALELRLIATHHRISAHLTNRPHVIRPHFAGQPETAPKNALQIPGVAAAGAVPHFRHASRAHGTRCPRDVSPVAGVDDCVLCRRGGFFVCTTSITRQPSMGASKSTAVRNCHVSGLFLP